MAQVAIQSPQVDSRSPGPVLELEPGPESRREWLRALWEHRGVMWVLARKDFQTRYKRASLGVLWAVFLPLVQATVMIVVFSRLVHSGRSIPYGAFVLSGVLSWSYFALVLPAGTTAIVDGTGITDKLWFPRAILPLVPCLSNLVSLGIAMFIVLVGSPILGAHFGLYLLLLIPACLWLVTFTIALTLVLSALQVYFRDVKFIVTAALTIWLYATPIMYPQSTLGSLGPWMDFNPMTGIISVFHEAVIGHAGGGIRALVVSLATTAILLVIATESQRRYDRLFVDRL